LSYWAIKIVVQKYKKSPYAETSWGFLISMPISFQYANIFKLPQSANRRHE